MYVNRGTNTSSCKHNTPTTHTHTHTKELWTEINASLHARECTTCGGVLGRKEETCCRGTQNGCLSCMESKQLRQNGGSISSASFSGSCRGTGRRGSKCMNSLFLHTAMPTYLNNWLRDAWQGVINHYTYMEFS